VQEECVLLDIDVDFLMIPQVSYDETDAKGPVPWCWPQDLVARLSERGIRSDLVTVAYSVEGGYTPLEWKYLGEEVAQRLAQPAAIDKLTQFDLMRAAALARYRNELAAAEQQYRRTAELAPTWAAPWYNLSFLMLRQERLSEARTFYERTIALDNSYHTPYAGSGITNLRSGKYSEAEAAFRETLSLDSQNAYAHLGLARVARHGKRWELAEKELRAAIALDPELLDAHRQLGYVLAKQGRNRDAIMHYERSLKLALAGHRPLDGYIVTSPGRDHVRDSGHRRTNARLGELYAREGDTLNAIACYRLALAGDSGGSLVRFRLAWAYAKQSRLKAAAIEAGRALKTAPAGFVEALRER
jgi:tetratricopeptide (TPR) repeat protein